MKTALLVVLLTPLILGLAAAEKLQPPQVPIAFNGKNIQNDEIRTPQRPPMVSNSPGEVVGTSYYAYQTNGSTGNRISVDGEGRIHIAWTKGTAEGGRPRYVYYNAHDSEGWIGETRVGEDNGTGFVTMDLLPEGDAGRALPAYHWADNPDGSNTIQARDLIPGFGIFEEFPLHTAGEYIWPYIARDINGRIHMIITDYNSDPSDYYYTYSDDDGETFSRTQTYIFTTDILSGIICSSPVSAKSAVVWTDADDVTGYYNVFVVETADGENWDWGDPLNITQYQAGDEYSAWADVDAIYDYEDVLHITYQGLYVIDNTIESYGDVMHWSDPVGHTIIATNDQDCAPQNYALCICKMSLGVDPDNNNLLALWSEMTLDDASDDGYSNGELYAAGSVDGGNVWGPKVNLTNSPTPGCAAPDCDSDVWSSMAEKVDGTLHIMYVDDDDPGAEWNGEGEWTDNNVLYLAVDEYDVIVSGVYDRNEDLPFQFDLGQNYPNPFNAKTLISLDGEVHAGNLAIYDVTGRMVRSFPLDENTRSVTWDGADASGQPVASGTYFYSVNFDDYGTAAVRKMTLLK
jgi:hypothetical protein